VTDMITELLQFAYVFESRLLVAGAEGPHGKFVMKYYLIDDSKL